MCIYKSYYSTIFAEKTAKLSLNQNFVETAKFCNADLWIMPKISDIETLFVKEEYGLKADINARFDGLEVKIVVGVEPCVIVTGGRGIHCREAGRLYACLRESGGVGRAERNGLERDVVAGDFAPS